MIKNVIYNEDCLEGMKKIPNNSIDLIVTDPPYGMSFISNYRKVQHKSIVNDDNLEWLSLFLCEIERVLKENTHCYIFCSHHNIETFISQSKKYFTLKNILVWIKNNTGMGDLDNDYAPQYEFILYLSKGKRKLNGRRDSNILYFNRTNNEFHPTQKPTNLIRFLINKSSTINQIVLDPFMGCGTTAVACKELGRVYVGFELEESYIKIAKKRLLQNNLLNILENKMVG